MGVVNVTSDSFSDGGLFLAPERAVAHGLQLRAAGADVVDVGGESTRPGATRVDPAVEIDRVRPVVAELAARGLTVSVDTMRAEVAEAALDAGAAIVNDVSGGRADPDMAGVVARRGVPWILMHWRAAGGFRHRADASVGYRDVVAEVSGELLAQVDAAIGAGVDPELLVLDPGLGFAKSAAHNWALLHELASFVALGYPVLVGASRKRFLGELLAGDDGPRDPDGREIATAVISALAAERGAWGVRVHDVAASRDAIAVATAWDVGGERQGAPS